MSLGKISSNTEFLLTPPQGSAPVGAHNVPRLGHTAIPHGYAMRLHDATGTYSFFAGGLAGRAVSSAGGGGTGSGRAVTVGGGPLGERSGRGRNWTGGWLGT